MRKSKTDMKRKKKKKIKKKGRGKKIRKRIQKNISKRSWKTVKGLKINKQIEQLKELSLLLKRKKKQIIDKQINRLKGLSLKKSASFIALSLNKLYEDFKKKQKIENLKQIKLEEREKAREEIMNALPSEPQSPIFTGEPITSLDEREEIDRHRDKVKKEEDLGDFRDLIKKDALPHSDAKGYEDKH